MTTQYGAIATSEDVDDAVSISSMDNIDDLKSSLLAKSLHFDLPVDADAGYRATEVHWCSFRRPHMRAFHGSWMCFCAGWLVWFSMAPLLPAMAESIPMTKQDLWTSNVAALVGTIFLRVLLGPLCDQYGGRPILIGLLMACSIPAGLAGLLVYDFRSLLIVRSLVGCVGATLVAAQNWITAQFTPECSGLAIAASSGWGALGGGLAQGLMGSIVYPTALAVFDDVNLAWRVSLVVPSLIAMTIGGFFWYYSDDSPLGSFREVKRAGLLQDRSAMASFRSGVLNVNAWILFVQFGCSLGIELTMESGISLHLAERFDLELSQASAYGSLFGLMNLFARALGGYISDRAMKQHSLRGRLTMHMLFIFCEGVLILGFIHSKGLALALCFMMAFAALGQMSMGTCMGIIPYVDPRSTGAISGIVGAGGNVGGVVLSNVFRTRGDTAGLYAMVAYCAVSSAVTLLITISGYRGLVFGKEDKALPRSLLVPQATNISEGSNSCA